MLDLEWRTQAVFVVTSLISSQIVSTLDELLAFNPLSPITTLECNESCGCVCVWRSVFVCPVSPSRPACWKWIHYWNSRSLLSGREIPLSPQMYLLYVCFVCEASVCLGCQVSLTRGWVLARGVRCVSQLWHCLTPAAFECSFKACLAECFSPHVLALFANPLLLLLLPSSSLLCFSRSLLPSRPSHLHCVLSSAVHRVLWPRPFAALRSSTTQLWPRQGPQRQRSMETMVEDRNMKAEQAVWHILYQEGPAVLVCVHVQCFLSFIRI